MRDDVFAAIRFLPVLAFPWLKEIAAVGLVALVVLGLAFLRLLAMLRQFAREKAVRNIAGRRTGYR